ncbi:MAG: twin-arginine translocation signal domain-containing protein, partial [Acidobacteriota bacterium]|nr:twin-arginine translocation signal domain-containing protein [Acidobacteriota bacterium]
MSDAENNKLEGSGLNRRSFLKNAGVAVAGGTIGASLTMTAPQTANAATAAAAAAAA